MGLRTVHAPVCHNGGVQEKYIIFSTSGYIEASAAEDVTNTQLKASKAEDCVSVRSGETVIPGLIELHTNGLAGVHFTTLTSDNHEELLSKVAYEMAKNGVTAWYATIPTVHASRWTEVGPVFKGSA